MTKVRSLSDWLLHIEGLHPRGSDGIEMGLERVAQVKVQLNQTETVPIFLVAGTNGKGSTCAMLDAILRAAGYRIGLYTSPHLNRYNERVRVNGVPVTDHDLVTAFERIELARKDIPLTYFEFGTLAAWEVFAASELDAIILEVGLGGRLDATNIYTPSCTIVTTIDIDHTEFLGHDRESIGAEKAGIFRSAVPAICGDAKPPASLLARAVNAGAELLCMGKDFGFQRLDQQWRYWGPRGNRNGLAFPSLRGGNQLANAATAIAALDAMVEKLPVAMQDIRLGLLEAEVSGRFQVIPGRPTIVLDVAHNAQSMAALERNLSDMAFHPATWGVFGMLADKDIDTAITTLKERITHWLPCTLSGRRATEAQFLAERLRQHGIEPVGCFETPAQALSFAQEKANEADRIICFGSFLTVAASLVHLKRAE